MDYVKQEDERKRSKLKRLGYKVVAVHHADLSGGIDLLKVTLDA
jgi:hypothetical protein